MPFHGGYRDQQSQEAHGKGKRPDDMVVRSSFSSSSRISLLLMSVCILRQGAFPSLGAGNPVRLFWPMLTLAMESVFVFARGNCSVQADCADDASLRDTACAAPHLQPVTGRSHGGTSILLEKQNSKR